MSHVLSRVVARASEVNLIEGFEVGSKQTQVPHLQLADDPSLSSSWDEVTIGNLGQ